jgi:hypothetical protein
VRHRERTTQSNATQVEASQPQRLAASRPPTQTVKTATFAGSPKTWGPCGLEIYGDINLIDFANLEDLLTPGPETEPTTLPSPSQLTAILDVVTSGSSDHQFSKHSPSGLADVTHSIGPVSLLLNETNFLNNETNELECSGAVSIGMNSCKLSKDTCVGSDSEFPSDNPSPPPLVSRAPSRESVTIEKQPTSSPEGKWVSALQIAVQRGHLRIVRILLQHGVDCNQKDEEGLTPLIHSIISDHEDVLSSLIQSGVRISEKDHQQRNAIHWAVSQRRKALLDILLKHCSCEQTLIESHDLNGKTPLHTAVDIGFEAGVRILMNSGANPKCWNTNY